MVVNANNKPGRYGNVIITDGREIIINELGEPIPDPPEEVMSLAELDKALNAMDDRHYNAPIAQTLAWLATHEHPSETLVDSFVEK